MIKKLRKKFIIAAMCAILIVLESMIMAVNIVNYRHLVSRADTLTEWIASEGGSFGNLAGSSNDQENGGQPPERQDPSEIDPSGTFDQTGDSTPLQNKDRMGFSKETPFETRYFTVILDADGTVKACDTGKIASIDEDAAKEYAMEVYGSGKTKGFSGIYRYLLTDTEDGSMIIFVDCRQEISTVKNFANISVQGVQTR